MGNAITASFGLDLAPLKRDFAQAEQIGKAGAAKVQSAIANANRANVNWAGIAQQRSQAQAFFASQGPRTAASFRPAPQGKYMSPAEQMAEEGGMSRRSLRGIGAGLTLVAGIHQLASAYETAAANAFKLRVENDKLLQPIGGASGLDELRQKIADLAKAEEDASSQKRIDNQSLFSKIVAGGRTIMNWAAGFGSPGEQGRQEASDKAGRNKRSAEALDLMADRQKELNAIEREGLTGSARKAALMKAELEHRTKLLEIARQETMAGVGKNTALRASENDRFGLDVARINRDSGPAAVRSDKFDRFRENEQDPGAYERKKREDAAAYARFQSAQRAYESSRAHGAYNQTGFYADLFGRNGAPGSQLPDRGGKAPYADLVSDIIAGRNNTPGFYGTVSARPGIAGGGIDAGANRSSKWSDTEGAQGLKEIGEMIRDGFKALADLWK